MKIKGLATTLFYRFFPIIKNTVFFVSFEGLYNDNPKYISQQLHDMAPDVNIVWASREDRHDSFPPYVKTVPYYSGEYFKYLNCAEVVVDNYTGLCSFGFFKKRQPFLEKIIRKKKQLCICTWHGTPLKRIGKDILQEPSKIYCGGADYCVAGCKYTADILDRVYDFGGNVRLYGTPRNDVFFRENDITALKEKLGLPSDKGVILFAPTFRQSVEMSGVSQFEMLDIKGILDSCKRRFGKDFVFVFLVHHTVFTKINNDGLIEDYKDVVYNGNRGDDMADYLLCTDVLITDYSGSFFDFAITKKPCFLFAPDFERYEKIERGLYLDYKSLPFPTAADNDSFINNIDTFCEEKYVNDVERFLTDIGNVEDGLSSKRITEDILKFLSNS